MSTECAARRLFSLIKAPTRQWSSHPELAACLTVRVFYHSTAKRIPIASAGHITIFVPQQEVA